MSVPTWLEVFRTRTHPGMEGVERARIVAEGAGAASLAAALTGRAGGGKLVCVVSGGNIDATRLQAILAGHTA